METSTGSVNKKLQATLHLLYYENVISYQKLSSFKNAQTAIQVNGQFSN